MDKLYGKNQSVMTAAVVESSAAKTVVAEATNDQITGEGSKGPSRRR